jgi:hypothetical protein
MREFGDASFNGNCGNRPPDGGSSALRCRQVAALPKAAWPMRNKRAPASNPMIAQGDVPTAAAVNLDNGAPVTAHGTETRATAAHHGFNPFAPSRDLKGRS